jgi:hypothetical protein
MRSLVKTFDSWVTMKNAAVTAMGMTFDIEERMKYAAINKKSSWGSPWWAAMHNLPLEGRSRGFSVKLK